MPTSLHERILYLEARLAMAEDKIGVLRSQLRLVLKSLIGWAELGLFYLSVKLFLRYAPPLKGKK